MNYVEKKWYWWFTWRFAWGNFTTIGDTLYYPRGWRGEIPAHIRAHEKIHSRQQKQVGLFKYIFLYLFCLPFFWNPWRYKCELEAYTQGSGITKEEADALLRTSMYGWLRIKEKPTE